MDNKVILAVDDEDLNRRLLVRRLSRDGYTVLTASGGQEAIDIVDTEHVDMVLLDVMMPVMDGFETLKVLRTNAPDLPVVMTTALGDSGSIVKALNSGASDYVTKPINFDVLKARMEGIFTRLEAAAKKSSAFKVEIGSKLGCYKVMSEIGKGATSVVYLARDTRLNRPAALKVLRQSVCEDPVSLARFVREAKAVAKVDHPGVVQIYDILDSPCNFIAMEYLQGKNLADLIAEYNGPMPVEKAIKYSMQIADILAAIHRAGIVHRDLKPQNLLVDNEDKVRLMDFGIVKIVGSDVNLTTAGTVLGTPKYISPEQLDSDIGEVSPLSDLYALGLILYEMLTGRTAIKGDSLHAVTYEVMFRQPEGPRELNKEVPEALNKLCLQLRALNPCDRPQTAEETVNKLKAVLSSLK
ncbi:protein kinase [bacterium]|nr:protein kinase [bacterium]